MGRRRRDGASISRSVHLNQYLGSIVSPIADLKSVVLLSVSVSVSAFVVGYLMVLRVVSGERGERGWRCDDHDDDGYGELSNSTVIPYPRSPTTRS